MSSVPRNLSCRDTFWSLITMIVLVIFIRILEFKRPLCKNLFQHNESSILYKLVFRLWYLIPSSIFGAYFSQLLTNIRINLKLNIIFWLSTYLHSSFWTRNQLSSRYANNIFGNIMYATLTFYIKYILVYRLNRDTDFFIRNF